MHAFTELVHRCAGFTLSALDRTNDEVLKQLETSGATHLVKSLQMIELQKAILAVGMFSMFEAALQDGLVCANGFREAEKILDQAGEATLSSRFTEIQLAINVLKHGRGRSYDRLVERCAELPFRVRQPDEAYFCEGDVSEVDTLIRVDDEFVLRCAKVIEEVSEVIKTVRPEFRG